MNLETYLSRVDELAAARARAENAKADLTSRFDDVVIKPCETAAVDQIKYPMAIYRGSDCILVSRDRAAWIVRTLVKAFGLPWTEGR